MDDQLAVFMRASDAFSWYMEREDGPWGISSSAQPLCSLGGEESRLM